jgi:hypothetical protein
LVQELKAQAAQGWAGGVGLVQLDWKILLVCWAAWLEREIVGSSDIAEWNQ